MPNTTTAHKVNETHLGSFATTEDAKRLAAKLTQLGHPTEYTTEVGGSTKRMVDGVEVEIPDKVWKKALRSIL